MAGILKLLGRAVDDLVKMGYPESVAKRISSGELPMDFESRMKRAMEQGYDMTPEYRGGALTQIETPLKLFDNGFYTSQNPYLANTYSMKPDGNVMPVLINKSDYLPVQGGGSNWDEIPAGNSPELQHLLSDLGYRTEGQITTDQALSVAEKGGKSGVSYDSVRDIGPYTRGLNKEMLGKAWDASNNTASVDPKRVRSLLSAAFDPEYTGKSIMGGLTGMGILGQLLKAQNKEDLD